MHQFSYDVQGNLANKNSVGHDFDYGNRLRSVNATESYRLSTSDTELFAPRFPWDA